MMHINQYCTGYTVSTVINGFNLIIDDSNVVVHIVNITNFILWNLPFCYNMPLTSAVLAIGREVAHIPIYPEQFVFKNIKTQL